MLTKFVKHLIDYPWVVIAVVGVASLFFFWQARDAIFDEDFSLIIDASLENYISRSSDDYQFYIQTTEAFGSENFMLIGVDVPPDADRHLDFFLEVDEMTRRLQDEVPGVSKVIGVTNTPSFSTVCVGKSYFHRETYGSFCESVLERYRTASACLAQFPTGVPPGLAGVVQPAEELDFGEEPLVFDDIPVGDTEEPEIFQDEPALAAVGAAEPDRTESDDAALACTPEIFLNSAEEWEALSLAAVQSAFGRIKEEPTLIGDLVSPNFDTIGLVIQFAENVEPFEPEIQEAIAAIVAATGEQGYPAYSVGQPRQQYQASKTLRDDMRTILPISLAIMAGVLIITFRSVRGVLIPLTVVLLGLGWTGGVFGMAGQTLNTLTIVLAPLLVCVGTAYVIYFMSQYFTATQTKPDRRSAILETLEHVTVPLSVTAMTTIAGFAALIISPIPAIKTMGIYACVGIASIIFMSLTLVPSILAVLPVRKSSKPVVDRSRWMDLILNFVSYWTGRHSRYFIYFWIGIGVLALVGVLRMEVNSDSTAFGEDTPIMRDFRYIERQLGGTNSVRIVLARPDAPEKLQTAETMRQIKQLENLLLQSGNGSGFPVIDGLRIDKIYSPVRFLEARYGDLETVSDLEVRRLFESLREHDGPKFLSDDGTWLQVSLRMQSEGSTPFLELREALETHLPRIFPDFSARLSGSAILASESANNIAKSQIQSVGLALVIIFVIMSLLFLSPKMGLLALYPNIVTIMIYFGVLGWLDIPLGVTISVIAAIALGIGVDDTIHYLAKYNTNVKLLRSEKEAAVETVRQVGRPMLATTLALALGFLVFTFSEMSTQTLFGGLLAFTLAVCLFTDLNFLPSIMARTKLITAWDYLQLDYSPEVIQNIPLFRNMSLRETKLATLMAYPVDLEAGQVVFEEGEVGNELFVILEGSVEVFYDEARHGREQILATLTMGASFGEMALFRRSQRTASIRAAEKSRLLALNSDVLGKLQRRYPKIAAKLFLNLATNLSHSLRRTDQKLLDKEIKSTAGRLIDRLMRRNEADLKATIDEIVADGVVTTEERRMLEAKVWADGKLSRFERKQLARLDEMIEQGKVVEQQTIFVSMLRKITPRQLNWMKSNFPVKNFNAQDKIWQANDDVGSMMLLLDGKLNILQDSQGHKVNIRTVLSGEAVAEEAIITSETLRRDEAVALEPAEILSVDPRGFHEMIANNKKLAAQLAYNLVCMLSDRLQEANRKLYKR